MFPNKTGVEQNTLVQSFFVSEIDQTLEILGSDYSIYVNNIEYTSGSINLLQGVSVEIRATSPSEANTPVHFVYILNGVLETFTVVSAPSQESVHVQLFKEIDPYFITQNNDGTTFLPDGSGNKMVIYDAIPSTSQTTIDESNFVERLVEDGDDIFVVSHHDYKIYRMRPNGDSVSIINTNGKPYKAIVVDKEIWVTLSNLNKIHILDYYTHALTGFVDTPARPTGIDVSSDNSVIAVACETAKQILIFRWNGTTYDQSIVDTFKNPISVAIDDELNVWGVSANSQNLFKISPDNSIQYHQTGQSPRDIKFVSVGDGSISPPTIEHYSYAFDGAGDYIQAPLSTELQLGTDDFTIEFWNYFVARGIKGSCFFTSYTSWGGSGIGLYAGHQLNNIYKYQISVNSKWPSLVSTVDIKYNQWVHIAIVRSNSVITLYINGVADGSFSAPSAITGSGAWTFGTAGDQKGNFYVNGYMYNVRIIKGTALYTSDFSVPTEPLTATAETVLLTANDSTINDDSASNHTITVFGNTSVSSEVPFGNKSLYFDGSGDYINTTISGGLGTSDFTIEMWVYPTNFYDWITFVCNTRGSNGFNFGTDGSKDLVWFDAGTRKIEAIGALELNTWQHVAVTRSGSTLYGFVNGVLVDTGTSSQNLSDSSFRIGGLNTGNPEYFFGNISNLRIIKGTALYTSNFTPPTEPLTAVSGTVLLTAQSSTFIDNSPSGHALAVSGDPVITSETPFAPEINPFSNDPMLGSFAFVSPAYVETTSDNYVFGANDFSIDFWFKPTALPGGIYWHTLLDMRGAGEGVVLGIAPGGIIEGYQLTVNEWVHFCYSRINGSYKFFINGSEIASGANAINYTSPRLRIAGVYNSPNTPWQYYGYISNFRMSNGSAIFTSDFTPRTTKSSVTNNTVLLTATGNGFTDESQYSHTLTPLFGAFESTDVPQLLRSFSFDGNDAINCNMNPIGTSDFTVEYWIKYNTLYNYITPISTTPRGTNSFEIGTWADGTLTYYVAGDKIRTGAGAVQAGVWHHIALSRKNSTVKLFVDGIEVGSTPSTENFANNGLGIGYARAINSQYVNGNMCNVRIIVGNGIYTENFTPPTEPLIDISGTVILTAQDAYFKDNSSVNTPLQIIGDPQASGDIPFDLFVGGGVSDRNITITSSFEDKIYTHEMDGSIRHAVSVEGFYPFKIS